MKLPGGGHGSPVIWDDKVFVTCEDPETTGGILLALSISDGRVLWQKKYKLTPYRFHNDNSYATSTPVVDAERVYVLWQTSSEVIIAAKGKTRKKIRNNCPVNGRTIVIGTVTCLAPTRPNSSCALI